MRNTIQNLMSLSLLLSMAVLTASCKKDENKPSPDKAKVTGISIELTSDQKGVNDVNFGYTDPAGVGGKTASGLITLDANASYNGTISLEDASQSPAKNVTADYQVTFQVANADATFSMSGQAVQVTTRAASTGTGGTLQVELKLNGQSQKVTFPLMVRQ